MFDKPSAVRPLKRPRNLLPAIDASDLSKCSCVMGLLFLVAAISITIPWARSYVIADFVWLPCCENTYELTSLHGRIGWMRFSNTNYYVPLQRTWECDNVYMKDGYALALPDFDQHWKIMGFEVAKAFDPSGRTAFTCVLVPYGSIATPLIAVSAILIYVWWKETNGPIAKNCLTRRGNA